MKINPSLYILLGLALVAFGCEPSDSDSDDSAGTEMAGTEMAGEMAGTEMAGETAGTEMAGTEMAGTEIAGTETAGTETAGTTMSGICNEVVEVGATCDPNNDCCARGSFCNPSSETEGQCVRNCEIPEDGDPVGCEERELCVENGDQAPDGITPGFCLPSDNCEPGNENLGCGEGEFHCLRVQNITLCIGDLAEVRAQDESLIVGEGEPCDVFNETKPTYCSQGLTCESNGTVRVCRSACEADADCGDGETCLDYTEVTDGLTYKFCSPRCELANQDCGETGACVITDILDDVAFGTCQEVDATDIAGAGEDCNVFDSDSPFRYCGTGLSCESNGVGSTCQAVCDETNACTEGETCVDATTRYNDAFQYSFCTVPCDPLAQDCAAGGGEDTNGNGVLDTEDANGNGVLDTEDANGNGMLDEGEDANDNGELDTEDANGNGVLDTEDTNGNGELDAGAAVQACAFSGVVDGAPIGTCIESPAPGEGQNTDDCTRAANDPSYWGSCDANNVCFIDNEATGEGSCGSFCGEGRSDLCTGEYQACTDSAIEGLGLCSGTCSLTTNEGCDEGNTCLYGFSDGIDAEGNEKPTGFCYENDSIGQAGLEEACIVLTLDFEGQDPFEYPFLNNCGPGQLCADLTGGNSPICLQTCELNLPAEENGCGALTCESVFQGGLMGVCLQQ